MAVSKLKMRNCNKCKGKMSYYSDEQREHEVWLCWKCGNFKGDSKVDDEFNEMIQVNPPIILELIDDKTLRPVDVE